VTSNNKIINLPIVWVLLGTVKQTKISIVQVNEDLYKCLGDLRTQ